MKQKRDAPRMKNIFDTQRVIRLIKLRNYLFYIKLFVIKYTKYECEYLVVFVIEKEKVVTH